MVRVGTCGTLEGDSFGETVLLMDGAGTSTLTFRVRECDSDDCCPMIRAPFVSFSQARVAADVSADDVTKPEKRRPRCLGRCDSRVAHGRSITSHGKTGGNSICTFSNGEDGSGDGGSASWKGRTKRIDARIQLRV